MDEDVFDDNVEDGIQPDETVDFGEEKILQSDAKLFVGDGQDQRLQRAQHADALDARMGFERYKEPKERIGFLLNFQPNEVLNEETKVLTAVVDYYFMTELQELFKVSMPFQPYFYVKTKPGREIEVSTYLQKKFSQLLTASDLIFKEDLSLLNHLSGLQQKYIKLSFISVTDLMKVKKELQRIVRQNQMREKSGLPYAELQSFQADFVSHVNRSDVTECIVDIREHDVPYHIRVAIDKKIFVGSWYAVRPRPGACIEPDIRRLPEMQERPEMSILAFDIETTKAPLKFPDAAVDQIMMISYMLQGEGGYLIVNREIVSDDIEDFEYTPKPEYRGRFTIFNEENEENVLKRFFSEIQRTKPVIFVTYNGDFFDWPFIETRAKHYGMSMQEHIGFAKSPQGEYLSRAASHLDCFKWVQRDSYLPVGSQNLKAVCKEKLCYSPTELDPEEMLPMAREQPQVLANYSVSDAVATYYLYMKYVHPFIFALCTIIPMEPDSVLRKGSGTLCEALLMVQAFHANVIYPNKQESIHNKLTKDGHVLESETYVGGHVEALESGIFRADLDIPFRIDEKGLDLLIENVERTVRHALDEEKIAVEDVDNFDALVSGIKNQLESLKGGAIRKEAPLIYHLDVAAMYPNIILTNRLQPSAIVGDDVCAACNFNRPSNRCRRKMQWTLREEYMAASRAEHHSVLQKLELETFPPLEPGGPPRAFHQLWREERVTVEKKRLQDYCRTHYKKPRMTRENPRESVVCQRENSFYVDTVRMFRDRRNELKALQKKSKDDIKTAVQSNDGQLERKARAMEVVYDSLQLAHKCILNSFYGYVMRRGARWFSMEMAGIVCHTGGSIIKRARQIIEKVGRPLELDTDGIWCALPKSFPEHIGPIVHGKPYRCANGDPINYPGAMLNVMVRDEFSNDQYQVLADKRRLQYETRIENSISFEVDGPYLAMILPAAKEEGKRLKKRYAVYNMKKQLKELKGFEVKRRGELQLIKQFQSSVFEAFLRGTTLLECYQEVAKIADQWLDILYTKGAGWTDTELCALISENRNMSRKVTEYGSLKSTAITTARRLAEFLGDSMLKDAGLNCKFVLAKKPDGAPIAERAIPLAIWQAPDHVRSRFLRKWLRVSALESEDIRDILDWSYYIERLNSTIQKIVTIPAAMQGIPNPVPRVPHPDWLHRKVRDHNDAFKQRRITDMFQRAEKPIADPNTDVDAVLDIENIGLNNENDRPAVISKKRKAPTPTQDKNPKSWRDALGAPPSRGNSAADLSAFLDFHRKKWAFMRQTKQQRKKTKTDHFDSGIRVGGTGVLAFVRQAKKQLVEDCWQVVQVSETGQPGLYRLWILIGNNLRPIQLKVHRVFYVNRKTELLDESIAHRSTKILPRAKRSYHLYEFRMEEQAFRQYQNQMLDDLTDPMVEGIYETQIPLIFRILVNLGTICRIRAEKRREVGQRDTDTLFLEDIERVDSTDHGYLDEDQLKYIYFFHHSVGSRAIFALLFLKLKKALIIFVDSVRNNLLPPLKHLFREEREKRTEEVEGMLPPDMETYEINMETDVKKVHRKLNKAITDYIAAKHGPTAIIMTSKEDSTHWMKVMSAAAELPVIKTHLDVDTGVLNPLQWQADWSRHLINSYFSLGEALMNSLERSRFLRVPWGNMPRDATMFAYDIFYARQLQAHNMVLWATTKDRPDFGGKGTDDIRLIAEDEEKVLQVNNPAYYSSCTLQVEVDYLTVCAILCGQYLHAIDGTSHATSFEKAPQAGIDEQLKSGLHVIASVASYDESAQVDYAFSILRQTIREIYSLALSDEGANGDALAMHVFRWLRSSSALLYDPALHRKLLGIMRKMLVKLVADCRTYGCKIVYATSGWMVVSTNKGNVHDALAHIRWTMDRIREDNLFKLLRVTPRRTWTSLLWLDPSNYCAVSVKAPENDPDMSRIDDRTFGDYFEDVSFFSQEEGSEDNPDLKFVWNLLEFLPLACREVFLAIVHAYVCRANQLYQSYYKKVMSGEILPERVDAEEELDMENPIEPVVALRNLIRGEQSTDNKDMGVTQLALAKLHDVMYRHQITNGRGQQFSIPEPPGSYTRITNPFLELVKSLCKVLSLHAEVTDEVRKLKRDMLKFLGVGEFSQAAEWKDPCLSYVLPEVICNFCHSCRDVDLCKEKSFEENGRRSWLCKNPACNLPYDLKQIERRLIAALKKLNMTYHLQDLRCVKCKQIFERSVAKTCSCGGRFTETVAKRSFVERLIIFENISRHFQMPILKETVHWMLKTNNQANFLSH